MSERGSTLANEVKSGVVTFLTMSYILLVNPQILGAAGELFAIRASLATCPEQQQLRQQACHEPVQQFCTAAAAHLCRCLQQHTIAAAYHGPFLQPVAVSSFHVQLQLSKLSY